MKVKAEAVLREIAGDYVLVPTGASVTEHNGLFSVSEVGARIWEILPECNNEEEIVSIILDEYDVDPETAKKDVADFLVSLKNLGLID